MNLVSLFASLSLVYLYLFIWRVFTMGYLYGQQNHSIMNEKSEYGFGGEFVIPNIHQILYIPRVPPYKCRVETISIFVGTAMRFT